MNERDFAMEIYRNLGHISKGIGGIMAAFAKRYAFGNREASETASKR